MDNQEFRITACYVSLLALVGIATALFAPPILAQFFTLIVSGCGLLMLAIIALIRKYD